MIDTRVHGTPSLIAEVLFWSSLALVFYTYAGYPLILRVLAIFIRRRIPQSNAEPSLTLLICAHNEGASIEAKLESSLALNYPKNKIQILVASDGSTDTTDDIVRNFMDRGIKLIRIENQAGKTHAQNIAVQYATGEIIVFSDATTIYHPDALRFLAANFADPKIGAASGCYAYNDPTSVSPNKSGARAYSTYDNAVRNLQSRVWSISGCCGCIYAVRRCLYTPLEAHIISDLVQPLHVLKQGYRVVLEPRALAWEAATSSAAREFSMRVRVVSRALTGLASVDGIMSPWPHLWLALQLWSHKLLRWAVPLLLLVLLLSSSLLLERPFYGIVFAVQMAFYATALLTALAPILSRRWRILNLPLYFCTVNAAAVGGFVQFLRGRRYTIWLPQREDADANI